MSSKTISLKNISDDPFKDGTLPIIDKFTENEKVDMGDVYHKTSKIKFSKSEQQNAQDLISTNIKTYINSDFYLPQKEDPTTALIPPAGGVFSIVPFRNPDGLEKSKDELEISTFYDSESYNTRNIVFNSNTPMLGTPNPDYKKYKTCNVLFMSFPADRELSNRIKSANSSLPSYNFSLYERLMVLFGHYSDAIKTIEANENLTIEAILNNYDYPFPTSAYHIISNKPTSLSYNIVEQELFKQIRKTISKYSMPYEDIYLSKTNPNEILFYKVEKWFSDSPSQTPDQVFFIPATSDNAADQNRLFIDVQVKDNKSYFYRVTAYYAVIGQQYFFSDIVDNGTYGECKVNVRPTISLSQAIIAEQSLKNIPAPPLPPFVSFHSKASQNNKIKIYLELQDGQEISKFIQFGEQPIEIADQYILSETEFFGLTENVQFRSEKQPAKFQIFRLSKMPRAYDDFSKNLIGTFENNNMARNMIVMNDVRPNKKYYYIFRTVNLYGSLSNPTPVYEIELIQDSDESRVSIKTVPIIDNSITETEKSLNINFRNLLSITVNEDQTAFNVDDIVNSNGSISTFNNNLNNVLLGEDSDHEVVNKIWGRKFKFRVRSNDSGKIIDFNIKVNLIREEAVQEQVPLPGQAPMGSQLPSGASQNLNNMSMADLLAALQGQGLSNMSGGN